MPKWRTLLKNRIQQSDFIICLIISHPTGRKKTLMLSQRPSATSHAQKLITYLFLFSRQVLSSCIWTCPNLFPRRSISCIRNNRIFKFLWPKSANYRYSEYLGTAQHYKSVLVPGTLNMHGSISTYSGQY